MLAIIAKILNSEIPEADQLGRRPDTGRFTMSSCASYGPTLLACRTIPVDSGRRGSGMQGPSAARAGGRWFTGGAAPGKERRFDLQEKCAARLRR